MSSRERSARRPFRLCQPRGERGNHRKGARRDVLQRREQAQQHQAQKVKVTEPRWPQRSLPHARLLLTCGIRLAHPAVSIGAWVGIPSRRSTGAATRCTRCCRSSSPIGCMCEFEGVCALRSPTPSIPWPPSSLAVFPQSLPLPYAFYSLPLPLPRPTSPSSP